MVSAKDRLKAKLKSRKAVDKPAALKINRHNGDGKVLSFSQQRLWLLDQLTGSSQVYNISFAVRLQGMLNVDLLLKCLETILNRHEALRTRFVSTGGEANIIVDPAKPLEVEIENVSSPAGVQAIWRAERNHLFDIANESLFRIRLLNETGDSYVLVVTMHHIISDAWSLGVFFKELVILYRNFSEGQPVSLQPLAIQYSDYAFWQRQWLTDERLTEQLRYWQRQLKDAPPLLTLPTDRPRPLKQSYAGAVESIDIPLKISSALQRLCNDNGATLFMGLLSAFAVLLGRYAGQKDIVIGTPIANRARRETEELMGFFVNTLVMRVDLSGDPTYTSLLKKTRETALEAFARADIPFEYLVEHLNPERSLSHSPIFQVMFILQNAPMGTVRLDGVKVTPLNGEEMDGFSRFDITLNLAEDKDGIKGIFEYNTDLFDRATIQRMAEHYVRLLDVLTTSCNVPVGQQNFLSEREKQQQLDWSDTRIGYDSLCVHTAFERQVERTPDIDAVIEGDTRINYADLNARAQTLAVMLRQDGLRPGEPAGICMSRSIDMITAILAVLKAGGAYVPIDPAYPRTRIDYIVGHAGITRILTSKVIHQQLISPSDDRFADMTFWCLDTIDWKESVVFDTDADLPGDLPDESAAYVIYTSGSTGQPKGVTGRHRSIMNRLRWLNDRHPLASDDVLCQKTNIGFVDHVAEIFQAITTGTPLVILPEQFLRSPPDFLRMLQQHHITRLTVVPSLLQALLSHENDNSESVRICSDMRLLISSGEALVMRDSNAFSRRFPNARLLNLYGSTEVGADISAYELSPEEEGAIPIGRAIANTELYVLDDQWRLLPQGGVGELYVGGDGLAQGYFKQAALTAERFVPNPFSVRAGARLYRTGDLVRYRQSGDLDYLGRTDNQVKIRGFRIELEEIDSVLRRHPSIASAVTVVYASGTGDSQLVAYVVAERQDDVYALKTQLKQYLADCLPQYMVPSIIQYEDKLPLTASGKIDRRSLPEPVPAAQMYEAPEGDYETLLSDLWSDVLKRDRIGRQDNFFEMGGHSLLVTQLVARIRDQFGIELPLLSFFEQQTLHAQAQMIATARQADGAGSGTESENDRLSAIEPINSGERCLPQPVSFAQQRLWFLDQLLGPNPAYNIPLALSLRGELDVAVLEESVNRVVERHESLRTRFAEHNGNVCQCVQPSENVTLRAQIVTDGDSLDAIAREERMYRFDLRNERLFRIRLLQQQHNKHVLLLTFHHSIFDGWSLGVFFQDLITFYRAGLSGDKPLVAELPVQYLDFSCWQRKWLEGGVLAKQLQYWQTQLADLPPVLHLPTDRPRPAEQSFRGSGVSFTCEDNLLNKLKEFGRKQGVTLYMTLLSAYAVLLYRYSGQDDIAIGTPVANRRHQETERLIGYFANTLVMRNNLSDNPDFIELLKRTRQTAFDAYANQDIPFEHLVDALNPERSLGYSPLFQVMFVLQNAPMHVHKLEGLEISSLVAGEDEGTSRFDLHLAMGEVDGKLVGRMEYNTDIFDRPRIETLVRHLENLLNAIVDSPDIAIGHLNYLSPSECERQLREFNNTARDYPKDVTVQRLFEQQAERRPNAPALTFEGVTLTYGQLNARVNRVANYLISLGVRPDDRVGIYAERSLEMVIGIYGVLKAGAAYLPLDPEYPQERIQYIVDEAQVNIVISHGGRANQLTPIVKKIIELDSPTFLTRLDTFSQENPTVPDLTSKHLAYVIYTSGSTGKPKGVMIEHRAIVNRIDWMQNEYQLTSRDVVLQKTPFSFDVSVWEFIWPLISGARLVVAAPQMHKDPEYLMELIKRAGVTVLHFVPSMLQALLPLGKWQECTSVRHVFCSGEALPSELARAFFATGTSSHLHNLYGPTEAAVDVSYRRCDKLSEHAVTVPIGRPIQNIQLYIVDENFQLVPEGTVGELLIAGDGLARGYVNRPDLTREKFIPDPFSSNSFSSNTTARAYRTGDLVRRLADGDIEYIGRVDHQVKINGFRIELGEIEHQLEKLEYVRQAVAIAQQDEGGFTRLVAYTVLIDEHDEVPVNDIKRHLQACLPPFMVPDIYISLESLPLSKNGKLDRKSLPALNQIIPEHTEYTAPETETEELLCNVWKQNLNLEAVSVNDNYFSLGGDSIRSISLVTDAKACGIHFQVKDLFMYPTIRGLSEAITEGKLEYLTTNVPEAFDLISDEEKEALFEHLDLGLHEDD